MEQGWENTGHALIREFVFSDFAGAMAFVNRVAQLAEERNHHPDIQIRWNKVTLSLSTHTSGGITEKDFTLAQAIDNL